MVRKDIWTTGSALPTIGLDFQFGSHILTPTLVGDYIQLSFAMQGSIGNAYMYNDATSVTDYVIQSGDYLEYDLYWETTDALIGVDLGFSDASYLRDAANVYDQNGFSPHPTTSATGTLTNSLWYHRKILLTSLAGKTTQKYDLVCESDAGGTVVARIKNIQITDGLSGVGNPENYGKYIKVGNGMSRNEGAT